MNNTSGFNAGFPSHNQAINRLSYYRAFGGTPLNDLDDGRDVSGDVIPGPQGETVDSSAVLALLGQLATAYPEVSGVAEVAQRLIVRLESMRHDALLPLALGHVEAAMRSLKKPAAVEVRHG